MKLFRTLLLCLLSIPLFAQDANQTPFKIIGRNLQKDGVVLHINGVRVVGQGWKLQADSATFNSVTREFEAHGDVTLQQGDSEVKAQDLTFRPELPKNDSPQ